MKIKYVGGMAQAILGDIVDPRYASWFQNEVKDVPDYDIDVVDAYNLGTKMNAITAVLNHGVHLVEESTGKNPLFVCTACGDDAHSEFFKPADDVIEYADEDGKKLCVACFLISNDHHIEWHMRQGHNGLPMPVRVKIDAAKTAPAAPVASDVTAPIALPPAEEFEHA